MEIGCWLKGRKMTNFEKIRQLSEEEMAKYIFDLEMGLEKYRIVREMIGVVI